MINDGINRLFQFKEAYKPDPVTGISVALFLRMREEAKTNVGIADMLKRLKMFYELSYGIEPEYFDNINETNTSLRRPTAMDATCSSR